MSYQVVLDSKNKVYGSNNNATFDVNFDTLLPKHVKHFKVTSSVVTKGGNYKNGYLYDISSSDNVIQTYNKGTIALPTTFFNVPIANATFDYPDYDDDHTLKWDHMTTEQQKAFGWTGIGFKSGLITELGTQFAEPYTSSDQCGYITNGGFLRQYIYLYTGRYILSYYLCGPQPVYVYIDDDLKTTSTAPDNLDWYNFTVDFDIPSDGDYLLMFQSNGPAIGLDNVSITRTTMNVLNATFDYPDYNVDEILKWDLMTTEQQEAFGWTGTGFKSGLITELGTQFPVPYTSSDQCGYITNAGFLYQYIYLYTGRYTLSYYLCGPTPVYVYIDDDLKTTSTAPDNLDWYNFTVDFDIPSDGEYLLNFALLTIGLIGIDNVVITRKGLYPQGDKITTDSAAVYVDFNTRALSYNSKNSTSKYVGTMTKYNSGSALSSMSNNNPPIIIQRPNNQITVSFVNNKSYDLLTADGDSYKTTEDVLLYFTETDEYGNRLETDMTDWKMTLELTPIDIK